MAQQTVNLKKLEEKFEALFKEETEESFNKWLLDKQQQMINMAQQTAVEQLINYMKENFHLTDESLQKFKEAKEMEKQQHEKFNKFLDVEKVLGISDLKTIERIRWYYNNYFNETYKKD